MKNLKDIWKNINVERNEKTLRFETPEDATEYLESMVKNLSEDILIANGGDEEISIDGLLLLFNDYRKYQEYMLCFRLVKNFDNQLIIKLERQYSASDCDSVADVLTVIKYGDLK